MEPKFKDQRQYAGQTFDTMPATPDSGGEKEEFVENTDLHVTDEIEFYSLKKSALEIAIDFARLTDGPTIDDMLKIAAMYANYIASKNAN